MSTIRIVLQPGFRPYLTLAIVILLLSAFDAGQGRFLTIATAFSALQTFATFGLVALGLGLTMLIGEFDLSVAGVFGLAGCVALLMGVADAWVGIACALGIGLAFGLAQGFLITKLDLGSVPVTLAGLLTATGTAYVLTGNRAVSSDHVELALAIDEPIASLFSIRSLIALGTFAVAGIVFSYTRLGRDLIALGSDRRASIMTGVSVDRLVIGSFVFCAMAAALGGTLLSVSLCLCVAVRSLGRSGSRSSRGDSWWCFFGRRYRHAAWHRRRCIDLDGVALWSQCHCRTSLRPRSGDRPHSPRCGDF